jgi:predicted 3-demethylubiquinone-9 3-methyltransferase (glyoxalase superfamily)
MYKIIPHLWFNNQAEEAVKFYASIFKSSKVGRISKYGKAGAKVSGMPIGSTMSIAFKIEGQDFVALNGGPQFRFTEAISFIVHCKDQKEIDYYWEKLIEGGDRKAQVCGWLKDKFGVSWQIIPAVLDELLTGPSKESVMEVFLKMKKLDIKMLKQAQKKEVKK